jgi:hypothetical protein
MTRVLVVLLAVALNVSCKSETGSSRRDRRTTSSPPAATRAGGLRDGDLIFHESQSAQSEMVRALTDSRWTHMGVIYLEPAGPMVFEAVSPVQRTPLKDWIRRGRDRHFVIKRLRDAETRLTPEVLAKMRQVGTGWLGRPYDLQFRWDDESLYCSELVYKLFERGAGVKLGKLQPASEMNLDDAKVQQALRKRFAGSKFDPNETVVTPDSIFNDEQLVEVEST